MEVVVVEVLVEAEEAVAVGHEVDEVVDLREEEEEMAEEEVLVEEAFHRVVALRAVEVGEVEAGALRRELAEETGWHPQKVDVLLIGPTSSGMSNERIAFVRARDLVKVGDGGGVDNEDILVHAVPRAQAPAWLMQKQSEGYELDLKLWAGLWMIEHNPDGSRVA